MKTSKNGINLLKKHEGLRLTAYTCQAGVLTIGYGHTGKDVIKGMTITESTAEKLLADDIKWAENAVNAHVKSPINQNQFDALVSFCFNVGASAFKGSTLLSYINKDPKHPNIYTEFLRWIYAGKKESSGLRSRRESEANLYLKKI